MELFTPELGLLFWMTLIFLGLVFILGKYAWPSVFKTIENRNAHIQQALDQARQALIERDQLQFERTRMEEKAQQEQLDLLKQSQQLRSRLMAEAKEAAQMETQRLLAEARADIQKQQAEMQQHLEEQITLLSLEIAEKILRKQMENTDEHQNYVKQILKEMHPTEKMTKTIEA